ncbi:MULTISPECIES: acetate--CoA ligase family protein [unclassified Sulfitobacter]|jgi:acyl-CoA synthetase (NDP forming)|uniref:acetate--CoA ligase family protein n=1 Tax=unclassified Sulfitobacter TaxID=196795 RepID=UPI000829E775|nr:MULTISPECIES: acetate--CoA ligase family protein [unclassified Sulfitobacter]
MSLSSLLNPSCVAIFGASQNPEKIGGRPIRFMKELGFAGGIYPINPQRSEVQGLTCYPDLEALPEVPETAIIAVPKDRVLETIAACAERGVKACVVMASGFGESGEAGRAAEAEMLAIAARTGMRIVGPNSQGLANFHNGAVLNFSTMFVEEPPQAGPVACISQSGAMSVVPYGMLRQRGIGVGHCHATGNDADVTVSELAAEVVLDPTVKLCILYIESLRDPENLALAAERARARGVPIIALKSGRSEDGQRAAASHTGAIATEDRVIDAFLERHGIWRAEGTEAMVHAAEIYLQGWKPNGKRVAIVSNSGATCVLAADAIARFGMTLAQFSPETEESIRQALPDFAASRNPVDITAALLSDSGLFGTVLPRAGEDAGVDIVMIGIPVSGKGYDFERFAQDTADFIRDYGKPVVLAAPQIKVRAAFARHGIPTFETEDSALRAVAQFTDHLALMERAGGGAVKATPLRGVGATLDEDASMAMVGAKGIVVPQRKICATVSEAKAFLAHCPQGIVLKANSAEISHKSEHGLVRVGLKQPDDVARHFAEIVAKLTEMAVPFEGVLAAEMLDQGCELVIGGHIDPVFGPVVIVGEGGIAVEAMPDNQLIFTPFSLPEVEAALAKLRIAPLFQGVRGAAPLNVQAVYQAMLGVADLLENDGVLSVDINPLITTYQGAVAADALLVVAR